MSEQQADAILSGYATQSRPQTGTEVAGVTLPRPFVRVKRYSESRSSKSWPALDATLGHPGFVDAPHDFDVYLDTENLVVAVDWIAISR
jgi:hypothetical protein